MTSAWWQLDWVWQTTGWALAAAGIVLLLWALFWDRARGRRRCPKCWYDLSGAVMEAVAEASHDGQSAASSMGVLCACPECGRKIARNRELGRTRRRRGWVVTAITTIAAGYGAHAVPQVQLSGWPGIIPTTLEILALPWLQRPSPEQQAAWVKEPLSVGWSEQLFMDLRKHRVDTNRLWSWQRWLLYERVLWGNPDEDGARERLLNQYSGYLQLISDRKELTARQTRKLFDWVAPWPLRTRERWPVDTAVAVELRAYGYFEHPVNGRVLRVTPVGVPGAAVETPMMGPVWWREATNDGAWKRHVVYVGPVQASTKRIVFDLELIDYDREAWEAGRRDGVVSWRGRVSLPVEVGGSVRDIMQPVKSDDPYLGLKTTYRTAAQEMAKDNGLSLRGEVEDREVQRLYNRVRRHMRGDSSISGDDIVTQVTAKLNLPDGTLDASEITSELGPRIIDMNMVTFGVRLEVFRDGELAASRNAWGVGAPRGPGSNYGEGELMYGFHQAVALEWFVSKPQLAEALKSKWTLKIVGDPVVALEYARSNRYWEGEIELPLVPTKSQVTPP